MPFRNIQNMPEYLVSERDEYQRLFNLGNNKITEGNIPTFISATSGATYTTVGTIYANQGQVGMMDLLFFGDVSTPLNPKLVDYTIISNDWDVLADEENRRTTEFDAMIESSLIIPKSPVATFANIATTYPTPVLGWTVKVLADGKIYRYDGVSWLWTDTVTSSSYDALLAEIDIPNRSTVVSSYSAVTSLDSNSENGLVRGTLSGMTLNNAIVNGDFSGGTTGWTGSSSTLSASNKILTAIGTGTSVYVSTLQTLGTVRQPNKYFFMARARVTNSVCQAIHFRLVFGGGTSITLGQVSSPDINTWVEVKGIFTATDQTGAIQMYLRSQYADSATANGKVMEIDGNSGVFAIDMTALGLDALTADQMKDLCDNGYFEGLKGSDVDLESTGASGTSTLSLDKPLNRVPNGVADSYALDTGVFTQNVSDIYTLVAGDITTLALASYANVDMVTCKVFSDAKVVTGTYPINNSFATGFIYRQNATLDHVQNQWTQEVWTDQRLYFYVPKGTYANLAAAQTALAGTKVLYQLATPVTTVYNKDLLSFENGTLYDNGLLPTYKQVTTPLNLAGTISDQSTINEHMEYRLNRVDGVWYDYVPTLTFTGTPPSAITTIARYTTVGEVCHFNIYLSSADGNGATNLTLTLPVTPKNNLSTSLVNADEKVNATWAKLLGFIQQSGSVVAFRTFNTATDAVAWELIVTGSYEVSV